MSFLAVRSVVVVDGQAVGSAGALGGRLCRVVGDGSGQSRGGVQAGQQAPVGADAGQRWAIRVSGGMGEVELVAAGGGRPAGRAADQQAAHGGDPAPCRADGGEHLQPGGEVVGQQRAPHPPAVDRVGARRQVVQASAVGGVAAAPAPPAERAWPGRPRSAPAVGRGAGVVRPVVTGGRSPAGRARRRRRRPWGRSPTQPPRCRSRGSGPRPAHPRCRGRR